MTDERDDDGDGDGEHERFMWPAIDLTRTNPAHPFGAVIVATAGGEVPARGVNARASSPLPHGESAAIADHLARHGTATTAGRPPPSTPPASPAPCAPAP
ncbi:hypothetical protein PUR71_02085 [Streptomyces sp. SP17BM10]|uniref:hypothetical protein n=1 Tax=Streptomyces sp. SP17BM10 TaxID=3002530 RepID=UPI002E76FF6A|nr:hypothetical protein [Streptomyces sp. SP17BM10]MEE1781728.1 hypothetical protein [Streptomyces sp. SP17BM10]